MIKNIQRIISAALLMLCALLVIGAFKVQAQDSPPIHLSAEDKFAIVESVLLDQFMVAREEFRGLALSSENLEFLDPAQKSKLGFRLFSPGSNNDGYGTIEYLVFRRIAASGNNAMVNLSRLEEAHFCFAPPVSREQTFVYQYHIESGRWTGGLKSKTLKPSGNIPRWSRSTGAVFHPIWKNVP